MGDERVQKKKGWASVVAHGSSPAPAPTTMKTSPTTTAQAVSSSVLERKPPNASDSASPASAALDASKLSAVGAAAESVLSSSPAPPSPAVVPPHVHHQKKGNKVWARQGAVVVESKQPPKLLRARKVESELADALLKARATLSSFTVDLATKKQDLFKLTPQSAAEDKKRLMKSLVDLNVEIRLAKSEVDSAKKKLHVATIVRTKLQDEFTLKKKAKDESMQSSSLARAMEDVDRAIEASLKE